VLTHTEFNN